jgi:hypothetical protein
MRFPAISVVRSTRIWFFALLAGAVFCSVAPAAQATFGVEKFFAAECTVATCGEFGGPPLQNSELFTQAAGHPDFGITDFVLNSKEQKAPFKAFIPEGNIENLQVDVPAGLSTNPQSVPQCSQAEFTPEHSEVAPGTFLESACKPEDQIGTDTVTVAVEAAPGVFANVPLVGKIYTFSDPTEGLSAEWGIEIPLEGLEPTKYKGLFSHTLLEGHVSWNTDYHEYFTIKDISKTLPLLESRLVFEGNKGTGGFLTNPSTCGGPQTTNIQAHSYQGESASNHYTTTVGASGCNLVPFEPSIALNPSTTQSDRADGATVELKVPQNPSTSEPNSSDLDTARVTLPEGMTINPAAAYNLAACTEEQAGLTEKNGERTTGSVTCPEGSKIGTISIEVPTLPAKSLEGSVYLGSPTGAPITGPPYTIYFNAESKRYGVAVRQKGLVVPGKNGRLTATFAENPQAPFSSLSMNLSGGSAAGSVPPLANPLACGTVTTESSLIPYTGEASKSPFSSFTVDGNGSGGACPSPLPFAPSQSTENQSSLAGALTSFKLNLTRPEGQQYLSQVKTVLPAGLLGEIPSVTLCGEAQAATATCPASSQIGTVAVAVGSGRPYPFSGSVYLTGPYNGAPYGMSIVVPAVAGPFNLGNVVTRATINVEPYTGRVVVTSSLPFFVNGVGLPESGIPLRLQKLTVAINRQSFLSNPTHCGALATESALTGMVTPGSTGSTQNISTPFQVAECSKLAFKPSFSAVSGAKTSRANGASLEVKITQGAKQMNLRQVIFQLPKQLPSRASTLRKACPSATFEAGPPPGGCTTSSVVGSATVTTPDLPGTLTGSAYMVSHANEAFPDLDLVLKGDGVTIVLVGHTHITTNGVTTSKFETLPDAPVSSAVVNLPVGPQSLLAANGNLCKNQSKLIAPTTMTGQNGRQIRKNIKISVRNCPIVVVSHRTSGVKALITVKTPAAGRVSGSGTDLKFVTRHVGKASQVTISVPLTQTGAEVLRKFGRLTLKVRVGFVPKTGHANSKAYATVTFRS